MKSTLRIKRVYEAPAKEDGTRVLVDRIWPRGLSKQQAAVDEWMKVIAPSSDLRSWFGHDPQRWEEFQRRYTLELDAHAEAWQPLVDAAAVDDITLLYSSRDTEHNNAVALRDYLKAQLASQ